MRVLKVVSGQSLANDATSTPVDLKAEGVDIVFNPDGGPSVVAQFNTDGLVGSTIYLEGSDVVGFNDGNTATYTSMLVAEAPAKLVEIVLTKQYIRVRVDELTSTGAGVAAVHLLSN